MKKHIVIANEYVIELEGPQIYLDGVRHHLFNKQSFKQHAKEQIDFHKSEVKRINQMKQELLDTPPYTLNDAEEWAVADRIQLHKEYITKFEKIVACLGTKFVQKDFDIQNYKDVPIDNFIELNGYGFACCIWHNEKTPSLKYYENTNSVYCFSCNKRGDVIDVVQQLNGTDFKGAIEILKKYA